MHGIAASKIVAGSRTSQVWHVDKSDCRRGWQAAGSVFLRVALTLAYCGGGALYASHKASAGDLSCSSPEAKSTVTALTKDALKTVPYYAVFDFDNTAFTLENVRTENGNSFKLECAATLVGDPAPKDLGASTAKNDAVVRQMFAAPFKAGIPIIYTVQNTDDGKLYVELKK